MRLKIDAPEKPIVSLTKAENGGENNFEVAFEIL
jgi:hypothetical protein